MRFVVYGAGAIGGVVGGRLFEAGHDVVLIARGEHGRVLRTGGLTVESPGTTATLPVPTVEHPREVDWREDDVALLAVKSPATSDVAQQLAAHAPSSIPVFSLQNGVSNERTLLRWFARVYAVCVMCPAAHLEPGVVQAHSAPVTGMLDLGRFPTGVDDTARGLAASFARSTFLSEPRADVMRWKYRKLVMNLGNAVQALAGTSDRTRHLRAVYDALEAEAVACFKAAGIDAATKAEDRERRADHLNMQPVTGGGRAGNSSWQSLQRATGSIETDYLNGEIVMLGRRYGVPTPANAALQRLSNRAAREQWRPGAMTVQDVAHELGL